MPVICWGNLAKSADDTQKIEQSMQDYVENHNENVNAHQVYGSSLYMHRIEALLDHQFGSVDFRFLSLTKSFLFTAFESTDGWSKYGTFTAYIFGAELITTADQNDKAIAFVESRSGLTAITLSKNPFFQTSFVLPLTTNQLIYAAAGDMTGMEDGDAFGFKISNGTLYAFVRDGATIYQTEITGITLTELNVYRAYFDYDEQKVYFYVNGVLKHTESAHPPNNGSAIFFTLYVKTLTTATRSLFVSDLLFMQDR